MERDSQELRPYAQSWPPGFLTGSMVVDAEARTRRRDGLTLLCLAVCAYCFGFGVADWACDLGERVAVPAHTVALQRKPAEPTGARAETRAPAHSVGLQRKPAEPTGVRAETRAPAHSVALQRKPAEPTGARAETRAPAHSVALQRKPAEPTGARAETRAPAHSVGLQRKPAELTGARAETRAPEPVAPEPALVAESAQRVAVVAPANISPSVQKRTRRAPIEARSERVAPEILAVVDEPTPMVSVEELNQALALADASTRIFASVDEASPKPVVVVPPPAAAVRREAAAAPASTKVVAIERLSVDGALPSKVVNRGVQRLLPQYDRCREYSDSATQRLKLSTTIDEAGHGRRVTVEGLSSPSLRRCLEQATAHLVVPAPDTGTARAHWFIRFATR